MALLGDLSDDAKRVLESGWTVTIGAGWKGVPRVEETEKRGEVAGER
jgi:hypothetical protein